MALPVSIPKDWMSEVKTGLFYSVLFIMVNLFIPQLTLGLPTQFVSFSDDFLLSAVAAPLVEEALFRFLLINALILAAGLSVFWVVTISSAAFSLFHYSAYGASLQAQNASFIGAFLFGVVVAIIAIKRRSFIIPIIIHFTFNVWLLIRIYS